MRTFKLKLVLLTSLILLPVQAQESKPLIDFLCAHATAPENTYRHVWREGDLVCWDNRTTMHMALTDFDQDQARHMLRATLLGEPSGFVVDEN